MTENSLSADHLRCLAATFRPAFQMLFTSRRLYRNSPRLQKRLGDFFPIGQKVPEHKKFRRANVQLCVLEGWECDGIDGVILMTVSLPDAEALRLTRLIDRPGISEICSIVINDDAMHVTLFGAQSLARFLKESTEFIREKFPHFKIPYGLDTEILFRPEKECFRAYTQAL